MSDKPKKPDGQKPQSQPTSRRDFFKNLFRDRSQTDSEKGATVGNVMEVMDQGGRMIQRMTRRKAVKVLVGTAAALAAGYVILVEPGPTILRDIETPDDYDEEVLNKIDFLEKRYGCDIELGIPVPLYGRLGQLSLPEKKEALKLIQKELAKYPPEYVKRLNPIIIFTNYENPFLGGIASRYEGRCFMVVTVQDQIKKPLFIRRVIHHELEHIADSVDGARTGICGDKKLCNCGNANNEEWAQLNPEGEKAYDPWWQLQAYRDVKAGNWSRDFARFAAKENPNEDQAYTADMLMTMAEWGDRKPILENFPVLSAKVEKLKEYMLRRSNGRMNEQYWKDLEAGLVGEKYWDTH